jgi:hypothetical protein
VAEEEVNERIKATRQELARLEGQLAAPTKGEIADVMERTEEATRGAVGATQDLLPKERDRRDLLKERAQVQANLNALLDRRNDLNENAPDVKPGPEDIEETKSALGRAREELENFRATLDEYEEADLNRLAALKRETRAVEEQIQKYEELIDAMSRTLDAASETPIEDQLQEGTPDRVDAPDVELPKMQELGLDISGFSDDWKRELERAREEMTHFGSDAVAIFNDVATVTERSAGQIAGSLMQAFQDAGGAAKEFWGVYQAIAIAQAIADTYKSANAAYSALAGIPVVGPALGAAAAAAAVAAGLARVSKIKSMSPPGSEGGSGAQRRERGQEAPSHLAEGVTGYGGGMALVGEEGPELVTMGRGANVVTNENTEALLGAISQTAPQVTRSRMGGGGAALLDELKKTREAFQEKQFRLRGPDLVTQQERQQAIYDDAGIK